MKGLSTVFVEILDESEFGCPKKVSILLLLGGSYMQITQLPRL